MCPTVDELGMFRVIIPKECRLLPIYVGNYSYVVQSLGCWKRTTRSSTRHSTPSKIISYTHTCTRMCMSIQIVRRTPVEIFGDSMIFFIYKLHSKGTYFHTHIHEHAHTAACFDNECINPLQLSSLRTHSLSPYHSLLSPS